MLCPHCSINFHDEWSNDSILYGRRYTGWNYKVAHCPNCGNYTIELYCDDGKGKRVHPLGATRGPIPKEVPPDIAADYSEAAEVLLISPKASAALARRCLQAILREKGYKAKDLSKEIDLLLNEKDPIKAIPGNLRDTVDAVRNFGNFSAHPINDVTQLQVIEVEPHEAEWCLDIIEEMFQHFYVRPAEASARKAALNAKLSAAGKPLAK